MTTTYYPGLSAGSAARADTTGRSASRPRCVTTSRTSGRISVFVTTWSWAQPEMRTDQ